MEGAPFGISEVVRLNKGSSKEYGGASFGYRYSMAGEDAFAVIVTDALVLAYVPQARLDALGLSASDAGQAEALGALLAMLSDLDGQTANGGVPLSAMIEKLKPASRLLVTRPEASFGALRFEFATEVEPGKFYACAYDGGSPADLGTGAFAFTGRIVEAQSVEITVAASGLDAVWEFFNGIDYRPFWVSMRTSLTAMLFVFVLGLAGAYFSMRLHRRLQAVLDSIFTIPMVLPPTVCGFLLLIAFGNSTDLGRWLIAHGVELVFTWQAAVLSAFIVAFPLMYRTARGAFEALDADLGNAARTLGWSNARIFFRLTLPLTWPSIAAGTVLAFARAMGEFGATLFVAGNYAGVTQTMPIAIYFQWMGGRTDVATFWVFVVILISFLVILFINWYSSRAQRYKRVGAANGREAGTGRGRGAKKLAGEGAASEAGEGAASEAEKAGPSDTGRQAEL
jgi:molybdate transport system permease protein